MISHAEEESVLLVKGTSLGLLSPLYQPPILFSPRESAEEYAGAFDRLESRLPLGKVPARSVKYGISGRKLLLECLQWRAEAPFFEKLERQLQKDGLHVKRYHPRDDQVPVSTLTRKILRKCRESR